MARTPGASATRELIRRAQQGDDSAFGTLVMGYQHRLECLIHVRLGRKLKTQMDVEDILQETYLRAYKSIGKFRWRRRGCFYTWLGEICEHTIGDQARYVNAKKRTPPGGNKLPDPDALTQEEVRKFPFVSKGSTAQPGKSLRRKERFERLEAALNRLSDDHREVVILAQIRGMPIKDIAEKMQRTPDAVSMLMLRALRQLKAHFGSTDSLSLPRESLDYPSGDGKGFPPDGDRG